MISLISQFLISYSLTVSPFSVTNHLNMKPNVEDNLSRAWRANTLHPQFSFIFKTDYTQSIVWYFKDSFDHHAGGVGFGPKIDLIGPYFTLGGLFGGYVRENSNQNETRVAKNIGNGLQFLPVAMATASIFIPISKDSGPEVNCGSAVVLTNCQFGWRMSW